MLVTGLCIEMNSNQLPGQTISGLLRLIPNNIENRFVNRFLLLMGQTADPPFEFYSGEHLVSHICLLNHFR